MEERTDRPVNMDLVDLARRERLTLLKLTPQERKFCERYVAHFDFHLALKEAGYTRATGHRGGTVMKSHNAMLEDLMSRDYIVAYINLLKESVLSRIGMSLDQIVDEYRSIAFANIDDYVEWTDAGFTKFKSSKSLTRAQKAGILEIIETTTKAGKTIKIKLHSKQVALDRLFEILKELEDRDDKPKGAPRVSQTQINLVLADPVKRRAIEHLAEGLFDYKIVLTGDDKDRLRFDENLAKMTTKFLEAAHGGEGTGKAGLARTAQITAGGGQEKNQGADGTAPDKGKDARGQGIRKQAAGESEAPADGCEEADLGAEPKRYDIDGL